MTEEYEQRLVLAFEQIGLALRGIHDTMERQLAKQFPEPKEWREAAYSRLPSEEDRIREEHGASGEPLSKWLSIEEESDWIGEREKEFIARAQTPEPAGPDSGRPETAEDQP
jgi:hypothetical protein